MIGSEEEKALWRQFADAQGSAPTLSPALRERRGEAGSTASSIARPGTGLGPSDEAAADEAAPHPLPHPEDEAAALRIAAWLDGRLSEGDRDLLEARLADRPELLDLALGAARSRGLAALWPKRAEARAAALLAPARPGWRFMAAAAAAVLMVSLGGFEMGRAGSELLSADSESDLAAELGLIPDTDLMETLL
jgi:hypothetical protein